MSNEKEIEKSTNSNMDEMVEITWEVLGGAPHMIMKERRTIRVTKSEAMLIEEGKLSKEDIYERQMKEEYEAAREAERKAKVERIGEIMLSKEPEMDEKVRFGIFDETKEDKSVYYGGHHNKYYVMRYKKTRNVVGRRSFATK